MKPSDHLRGLTQEALISILFYDQNTGLFTWLKNTGRAHKGDVAGKPHPCGYVLIGIKGRHYLAHRLAWFYVYGEWPVEIDHINLIKNDNRIGNLRTATRTQNNMNRLSSKHSTSGCKGASLDRRDGKYDARIRMNGKTYYLGRFSDPEDATKAYHAAAKKLCGEFARVA